MQRLDETLPATGDVIADKYRLERLVGEGAMGRVYRAQHLLLGQSVAIKLLRASVETADLRARFVREAQATMALRSEHVVRVYDLGVLPSNTPYMVLEYLEGTDLRSVLESSGPLAVTDAVDHVLQVCEALAEAHAFGIVHRDLKPQNLFLTQRADGTPCIKLLDFGVSKFDTGAEGNAELTTSHVLLGSPVYMSPEQIRDSRKVDARADIWSLGVVLYMLVGGGRPFDGEGLAGTCASIMVDAPHPLAARCPNVPPALEAIILRCLHKKREQRMPDVATLARSLVPFASAAGVRTEARIAARAAELPASSARVPRTEPALDAAAAVPVASVEGTALDARAAAPPPRRRRSVAAVLAVTMLALFATTAVLWRRAQASARRATVTVTAPAAAPEPARAAPEPPPAEEPSQVAATAAPAPASAAPSVAPRHASAPARPARPSGNAAKRKGQVDRNGVPILE
jgi:eukaryotic-like serine/threonine-protein kinase